MTPENYIATALENNPLGMSQGEIFWMFGSLPAEDVRAAIASALDKQLICRDAFIYHYRQPSSRTLPAPATDKWTTFFLGLAAYNATASKDPSAKCGAVIVNGRKRVVGMGWNGFPDRVEDTHERLHNRETKLELVIHAEVNAILNATASVEGCTMYVTAPCCGECAKTMVQAGIHKVIWRKPEEGFAARWAAAMASAKRVFDAANVEVVEVP